MDDQGQPDTRTPHVFRRDGKDYVSMDEYLRLNQRYRDFYAPRWVSVEERLPEQAEWAVVWDSQNMIAVVAKRFGESDWCMSAGDEYGFESRGVTHWMPLPSPPPKED